jgi:hypothetical protein
MIRKSITLSMLFHILKDVGSDHADKHNIDSVSTDTDIWITMCGMKDLMRQLLL